MNNFSFIQVGLLSNRDVDDWNSKQSDASGVYLTLESHQKIDGAAGDEEDSHHNEDDVFGDFVVKRVPYAQRQNLIVAKADRQRVFVYDIVAATAKFKIISPRYHSYCSGFRMHLRKC